MLHALTHFPSSILFSADAKTVATRRKRIQAAIFAFAVDMLAFHLLKTPQIEQKKRSATGLRLGLAQVAIKELDHDIEGIPRFRHVSVVEKSVEQAIPDMQFGAHPLFD